MLKQTAN